MAAVGDGCSTQIAAHPPCFLRVREWGGNLPGASQSLSWLSCTSCGASEPRLR